MSRVFAVFLLATVLLAQPQADLSRLVQEGDQALAAGRYADAERAFTKVQALAPGTAEVYAKLGVIYFQQGKFAPASQALSTALKLKPGLPNADALLAMSLSEQGRYVEALPNLEKAFRKSTDAAMKRMLGLQLERAYTGTQQDAKAVEVALELNRLYPEDPEVLYHSGRLFGNFAYLTMKKLSEVAPQSLWRHQAAGEVYESQENYSAAIAEYRQVLASDAGRPGIHFRIGRALLAQARQSETRSNEIAEAAKEFEQELRIDPSNANAAYELGELQRKSGQLEVARGYFETGLKYYPDFEDAQIALGRTLIAMEKPEEALPLLQKAIALNPDSDVAYYALAQAHRALGHGQERQAALAKFRALRDKHASQEPHASQELKDPRRQVTRQEVDASARQPE